MALRITYRKITHIHNEYVQNIIEVKKMNGNVELLNYVYQNSQMGVNTIEQLLEKVEDEKFKEHLNSELKEYKAMNSEANELLEKNNYKEKGIGTLGEISTYLMINMKTLTNKSPSHISEMMIQGSVMGIIDAIKNIKKYKGEVEKDILALMKRLLKFEENNVEELKKYL